MSRSILCWGTLAPLALASACGDAAPPLEPCQHVPGELEDVPVLLGLSPPEGPPGTSVVLTGARFDRIDDRFAVAYGDFSQACDYATLEGEVRSATEIEVVIPEDATLSGYLYLLADGLTVSRAPNPFTLERDAATIVVENGSQFPIVSVAHNLDPILEAGVRVDVEDSAAFEVRTGPMRLDVCAGILADGAAEPFACQSFEGRLSQNQVLSATMAPIRAAQVLMGTWVGTWQVGEDVFEERLDIEADGYWELRFGGRVVDSGEVIEPATWPAYRTDFAFGLRASDPPSEAELPVRTFTLLSPRAGGRIAFYRPES